MSTPAAHSVGLHRDAREHHVAAVRAAPQRGPRTGRARSSGSQSWIGGEVGDRVEPELDVVEGDPALAVARRSRGRWAPARRSRPGRAPGGPAQKIRVASASGPPCTWTTEAPPSSALSARGVPEARDLLAVRRRDAVHGRRHQTVAQLRRHAVATVDEHGAAPVRGVDADDRARVGRASSRSPRTPRSPAPRPRSPGRPGRARRRSRACRRPRCTARRSSPSTWWPTTIRLAVRREARAERRGRRPRPAAVQEPSASSARDGVELAVVVGGQHQGRVVRRSSPPRGGRRARRGRSARRDPVPSASTTLVELGWRLIMVTATDFSSCETAVSATYPPPS